MEDKVMGFHRLTSGSAAAALVATLIALPAGADAQSSHGTIEQRSGLTWLHLSSTTGGLPVPGPSTEQTGALVANLDKSGINDFVLSFRKTAPALVWYRHRKAGGWDRYVIDRDYLTVEAGGADCDIDGDGFPDLVFGSDYQGDEVWWWENPAGHYDPNVPWKRHLIKKGGGHQHHDQIFGDFKGTGKPQLVFWNQGAKTLFIADIPANPREAKQWDFQPVFSGAAGEGRGWYAEGVAAIDVDGDGKLDILAGNYWFKHEGGDKFKPIKIADFGGRIAAGRLIKESKYPQIVINSGDGVGPLKWYECKGDPMKTSDWVGHDLVGRDVIHGHSLQMADVDGDGNLDIFAAEMAKWTESRPDPDNPNAVAWIFFGDGQGHLRKTEFAKGIGFHEARVADLNGDGRMDILDKPYNWQTPRVDVWLQQAPESSNAGRGHGRETRSELTVHPTFAVDVDAERDLNVAGAVDQGDDAHHHKINVGLQLYSLRNQMDKDVPGTLKKVHDWGITDVEVAGLHKLSAQEFHQELEKESLHAGGIHDQWEQFSTDVDGIIKDAKTLGVDYVTLPWIPHDGDFTIAQAHDAAKKFNEWGRKLGEAGLHFCYHPHGYEFRPTPNGTAFDVLMKETDPKLVNFELDVFWAFHAGQDPVKMMRQHPTRFPLLHLKDMRKGTQTPKYTGAEDVEADVALGAGQIDIPAILKEAEKIGVKHYYIEDESSRSEQQVPKSIEYVRSIGF
jgi:sugar phosphate isomerase/epimerase